MTLIATRNVDNHSPVLRAVFVVCRSKKVDILRGHFSDKREI
jgi:hypothetical protein